MSHTDFLHILRRFELERVLTYFPQHDTGQCNVLEVGAGTGYQARFLSAHGFPVTAVDIRSSAYREERVYPITEYDGRVIPSADASFRVVFSSNVLEHVRDIGPFLDELRRVMTSDGVAIHILPTPAWRFWTILTHYAWLVKRLCAFLMPRQKDENATANPPRLPGYLRGTLGILFPLRHGERGVTVSEMYFYRRRWWLKQFEGHGYKVIETCAAGIFYTGSFVFGPKLSIARRQRLARILGSACRIYILRRDGDDETAAMTSASQSTRAA